MIKSIPLNKLIQSPRNVRRQTDPQADVELKASIAAHGLLQNLIVRPTTKGRFEVEAGERRRAAMAALVEDKLLAKDQEVTCLVLDDNAGPVETSLAENFHRLAMNPADEARAFADMVAAGCTAEEVARRFGLTVRFVEGRLRLAHLAPAVFEALACGDITLDLAKAYGATADHAAQTRVFEQMAGYYAPSASSIRRMMLAETVRASDPRAKLVGRDTYLATGGRIERELFDDDEAESWLDIGLLEQLATTRMEEAAKAAAEENGLAWVKPTLDCFVSHELLDGLIRLPTTIVPLTQADQERLEALDASYDQHAAILEDEESAPEAIEAAEAAIEAIERECQDIRHRPPVLDEALKPQAGMILVLGRDGTPALEPVYYGMRDEIVVADDDEVVAGTTGDGKVRAVLSRRLVGELAMQRRDVLALHVASDPALALDLMVFTLADTDPDDWRARAFSTLRGSAPNGPIVGFEPADASATIAFAELRSSLNESWRSASTAAERFDLFRALAEEERVAWTGVVMARTLEASLRMAGPHFLPFHDHLAREIGIDIAQWWRPTAANYFDRVSKAVILGAMSDVGGPDFAARFATVKKADLAMSAERIFAGHYSDGEVRARALAWVPDVMRFEDPEVVGEEEFSGAVSEAADPSQNAPTLEDAPCALAA